MTDHQRDAPVLDVDVPQVAAQSLIVDLAGPDLPPLPGSGEAADEVLPHPVAAFAAAAGLGMLGGSAIAPWDSGASAAPDPDQPGTSRQRWRVSLANVDPGALRVLLNLVRACVPAAVTVRAARPAPEAAPRLDPRRLALPGRYPDIPFAVHAGDATGRRKNRRLELRFATPPADAEADAALAAVTAWWNLLVAGGYAAAGDDPAYSATGLDEPYWHDEVTIACFFEVFDADERAFDPLVNWAARAHRAGLRVDSVEID